MAYAVYSFTSQYTDTGLVGFYVGTREENLAECLEIASHELAEVAAGRFRAKEVQRAKENLKGRIVLSMESTSNRMSRLGKSLITDTELLSLDRLIAEIDAVEQDELADLASVLLRPELLSAAGIGPGEAAFNAAVKTVNPGLVRAAAA
jgi:predicted Zn-dependent peptidase